VSGRNTLQLLRGINYVSFRRNFQLKSESSYNINQIIENTKTEIMRHIDIRNNRFRNGIIGILLTSVGVCSFYYDDIKTYITAQSTDVATGTMNNPKFKEQTIDLSSNTVKELCQDSEVQRNLTQLLVTALNTDEVKEAAVDLIEHVYSQDEVKKWTMKLVTDIISSDEVKNTTKTSFEHILQNPNFRKEVSETLYDVVIRSITPSINFWNKKNDKP
jgi:uncharacterized membrane-anchored protein YjiN (DUF445 family)